MTSEYNPLAGSRYTKLQTELNLERKGLINIQNIDVNECFKSCLLRFLNPADSNPEEITKTDKNFAEKLDFKDINVPVKVIEIHKIEK